MLPAVISEEDQARTCLNLRDSNVTTAPLPINMTANLPSNFLCNEDEPYVYTFICTHYGRELLWYFNGISVTSFQDGDAPGRIHQITYPESSESKPLLNITAVLIQIDESTTDTYNVPFCVSSLTLHPYDGNNLTVIPFSVSCHTFCADENHTEVCQKEEYNTAGIFKDLVMDV